MAKKKTRKTYSSKGQRDSVSSDTKKAMRRDRSYTDKLYAQIDAWTKNKKTVVTIANPDKNATNKRFIRVPGNDSRAFGEYRKYLMPMKQASHD